MSRIYIYGSKKDRKAVLEYLQRQQILDIIEPDADNEEVGFSNINTSESQSEFLHNSQLGEKALDILNDSAPEKKGMLASLNGREALSAQEYYSYVDNIPKTLEIVNKITELSAKKAQLQGDIIRCRTVIEELKPWALLDSPIEGEKTQSAISLTGVFGGALTAENILSRYYANEDAPSLHLEVINSLPQQTYVFAVCKSDKIGKCEAILREIGFSRPKTSYHGIPSEEIESQEKLIEKLDEEIADTEKEIISYADSRDDIKFMTDYYAMRAEKYNVLSKLSQRNHVFVISGYVPKNLANDLSASLEHNYSVAVEVMDAEDDAPILLKNAYVTEPVETVVKTFAMPRKGEIDPTSIMAFFYYVFFGLMLSDAAYGLIMVIGCGLALAKFKNMELGMKKSLRMFMYCGISTTFWGVMFGSYFGDAVAVVSSTFFGHEVTIPPVWFEPVNDPMRMLMFSFLLGIIHLFTGLGVKLYQCIKAKDYMSALTDCIFWYMLVGGGIVYLFHVDMFLSMAGLSTKLPTVWANVAAIIAAAGALGIILLSARSGSAGKRLAKGAYALYGVTSWLSDILSYSRLLALGLATGVIATVFNKMGSMFGGGIIGAIIFILVFAVGHTLNIGVNLLGAYVHTNRLQFVEFFGKFYEGGGREFKPFAANTKYYKFKEE
jgi:V/A-type H+-transporting ATPase subunit I